MINAEFSDGMGVITLKNAPKRNCLSSEMISQMLEALSGFEHQKAIAVLVRAEPDAKVWSAGHDVNELPLPGRDPLPYAGPLESLLRRLQEYPGAVVAMVQGSVWGGACDLAFSCDILRRNSPLAIRSFKRQFRLLSGGPPISSEAFELIQSIRREVYDSQDYAEGIRAFHEKRPPVFQGK